jgi:hypothetical protein
MNLQQGCLGQLDTGSVNQGMPISFPHGHTGERARQGSSNMLWVQQLPCLAEGMKGNADKTSLAGETSHVQKQRRWEQFNISSHHAKIDAAKPEK